MDKPKTTTRERLIKTASDLFYNHGIGAVSVDAIAEKAGLTKRTLYYHFRSKDDLVEEYLRARDQPNLRQFEKWFSEIDGDVADKVQGIFRNLAHTARHPKWKGCGFLRTSVELINMPGHPAVVAGRQHKKRVEDWLASVLSQDRDEEAARLVARQLVLLLDGAFAVVLLHRDPSYLESAGIAAFGIVSGNAGRR